MTSVAQMGPPGPPEGVLVSPHEVYTGKNPIKKQHLEKVICFPSVLAGEINQSVSLCLFSCLFKVHKDLLKTLFDKMCMVLHLTQQNIQTKGF